MYDGGGGTVDWGYHPKKDLTKQAILFSLAEPDLT